MKRLKGKRDGGRESNAYPTQVCYFNQFSELEPAGQFLLYDLALDKDRAFRKWRQTFLFSLGLQAGEKLKSIKQFESVARKVFAAEEKLKTRASGLVAAGGGSVGDFVGFLASTYKRGIPLVHLPTTWLAAVDSAHGGKTALNLDGVKNQIGSFYPAEEVWIVREAFDSLSAGQEKDARAEVLKMALLETTPWAKKFLRQPSMDLWQILPEAVRAKEKVVRKDLRETKGLRWFLNLGHTVGHVLEAHYGISHGKAVGLGLHFAILFSNQRGLLAKKSFADLCTVTCKLGYDQKLTPKIPAARFARLLRADKKGARTQHINYVLLRAPGMPMIQQIAISEITSEAKRQGWVR